MKKLFTPFAILIFLLSPLAGQDNDIDSLFSDAEDVPAEDAADVPSQSGDIDSLFSDGENASGDGQANQDQTAQNSPSLLDSLINKESFHFGASFDVTVGYSPGWEISPEPEFSDSALMFLSSKLTLDATVNDSFRFLQSYNVAFPAFEPKVSEFFADFDFGDLVYFRMGRQNLTWGISRYYKFTNLHARLPQDFGYTYELNSTTGTHIIDSTTDTYSRVVIDSADTITDTDSYSIKMDIPIGIGGFQGLMLTRNGYFSDASTPAADELGWGGYFNLALPWADMTIGGFYHKDLNLRGFFSAQTTLFKRLELYTEAVVSYDQGMDDLLPLIDDEPDENDQYVHEADPDSLDFGANIGFYIDFLDGMLEFSGEYYYNGEETELEPLGTKLGMSLVWGHNLAGGFALNLLDKTLKIEAYTLYNISENTGVAAPVITWKGFGFLELKAGFLFVYGSEEGTYTRENPDPSSLDRNYSLVLQAKVSGKI
ncbi:MAG: hypothetical protein JXR86_05695 [Spirochaetales bacterium]|nr:hypothetical protein [Spirochaetales bacterium]